MTIVQSPPSIQTSDPLNEYNATSFVPEPYSPSRDTELLHRFTRFGHTNDFEAFVNGTSTENYIVGCCAAAMLIFAIALVWFMLIIGFKVAGPKKVGFLAGKLHHPDYDLASSSPRDVGKLTVIEEETFSSDTENESLIASDISSPFISDKSTKHNSSTAQTEKKFQRKVNVIRGTFFISGLCVIVCGALFYAKGMTMFKNSLENTSYGLELIQKTAYRATNISNTVLLDKDQLINSFNDTKARVGGQLCNGEGFVPNMIRKSVSDFEGQLQAIDRMVNESIAVIDDGSDEIISVTNHVNEKLEKTNIIFGVSIAISVVIGVLILAMLMVTYFSATGVTNRFTNLATYAILWPLFVFLLILFWIFALLFLVSALATSDFCVDPDKNMQSILVQFQDQLPQMMFQFIVYWVSGCKIQPDDAEMENTTAKINDMLNELHSMTVLLMNQPINTLESQCGLTETQAVDLQRGAELLHNSSHSLNNDWIDVRHIMECKVFNPIYTVIVHDAVCVDGVGGLEWLFPSCLLLAIFAMLMLTFRAALYPVKRPLKRDLGLDVGFSYLTEEPDTNLL